MLMKTVPSPRDSYSRATPTSPGNSSIQGSHQVDHTFTSNTGSARSRSTDAIELASTLTKLESRSSAGGAASRTSAAARSRATSRAGATSESHPRTRQNDTQARPSTVSSWNTDARAQAL